LTSSWLVKVQVPRGVATPKVEQDARRASVDISDAMRLSSNVVIAQSIMSGATTWTNDNLQQRYSHHGITFLHPRCQLLSTSLMFDNRQAEPFKGRAASHSTYLVHLEVTTHEQHQPHDCMDLKGAEVRFIPPRCDRPSLIDAFRYLSVATSYSYVMHALLAFSASHLAWISPSPHTRKIQIQHGGTALGGLHNALSSFSKFNADAILATSILLMTQANDWRTWSSLEACVRTVASAVHELVFADLINLSSYKPSEDSRPLPSMQERHSILTNVLASLQRLQPLLVTNNQEAHWIEQLLVYVSFLMGTQHAYTAAEQFDQLYGLRKWVIFVPCLLLGKPIIDGPSILVVAHLYATALSLEPLFPALGASFCAAISLPPLERIIQMTVPMQTDDQLGQHALEIGSLMHFPQQAVSTYRARLAWIQ
ncbi:hypothetical protein D6C78_10913, partial [Aureobasidium pullulans]